MPRAADEIAKLKRIFDTLDIDGDGRVQLVEVRQIIAESAQTSSESFNPAEVDAILRAVDRNQNGILEFHEFAYLMSDPESEPRRYRRLLYRVADTVTSNDQQPEVHSYLSEYSCCPPPIFILLVTILEAAVFIYYVATTSQTPNWFGGCPGCTQSDGSAGIFIFAPSLREQAWRFVTYILLHAGLEHILGNLIIQLVVGVPLELVHKIWRIAPLYLLGVILGAMIQYTLDPDTWLVGASGGVYALIVAHLANTVLNWSEMRFAWLRLLVFGGYMCFDVGHALYRRFGKEECVNISYAAHLGGAITGFLLGVVLLRNLVVQKWERVLWWTCLVLYILIFVASIAAVVIRFPGSEAWFNCNVDST